MAGTAHHPPGAPQRRPSRLRRIFGSLLGLLLIAWASLAIFYSNLPWFQARLGLAIAFAAFSVWAVFLARAPRMRWVFAVMLVGVIIWEVSIEPSHDRPWRPEVAVLPRATIDGDRVRISGVRDFDYRNVDDMTVRYVERDVLVSHLTGLDFYISYWVPGPVAHTFVSFTFDNAPPISVSIETRPEIGEGFSPLASLFKQYELIYVVGEERDIVRVRTNYRDEDVYLYRIQVSAAAAQRLFLVYLERINEIADRPEWYHLLKSNCTLNIVRYANAVGREGRRDLRHFLNGWADRYLFQAGFLDSTSTFQELRARSHINDVARSAGSGADFPVRIRQSIPAIASTDPDTGPTRPVADRSR